MFSRVKLILAIALTLGLAACGGEEQGSGAADVITGFRSDPAKVDASFAAIHGQLRERPDQLRKAALEHLDADDRNVRYASVYALAVTAGSGESFEALRPILESTDISERLLAAGSLVARGEKAAIPVLVDALGTETLLRFKDPPKPAWEYAHFVLVRHTGRGSSLEVLPGAEAAVSAKRGWEQWWAANESSLRWNATARRYE